LDVNVPLGELTQRQLLVHHISLLEEQVQILRRLEIFMANLDQSVEDLTAAVDDIGVRFQQTLEPLRQALSDAQAAFSELSLEDEATKQALADALSAADSAASDIEAQVAELNQIGTPPSDTPPSDTPPSDTEPPADTPAADEPTA
jgi:capsule polysaccharide export protein KpsE/RkpR